MTATIPVSELILDYDLYPRHDVDRANVASIGRAIEAGEDLPPIVADRETKKVIDGFHRVTAFQRFGETHEVKVDWRDYDTEQDMLIDAVAANARHGERLTRYDQARCVLLGERLGIDPDRMAKALALTVERVGELRATKTAKTKDNKPVEIKATGRHLAGKNLSKRQHTAIQRSSGMSVRFYAEQVTNAISGDLVRWDDEGTREALVELFEALEGALTAS